MTARDFSLLAAVCFVWGVNIVVTRFVVLDTPPLFYAFLRFAVLAVALSPFLWPAPRQFALVAVAGLGVGAFNFVFLFVALATGTASSVAVALQLGLPFTTILSMVFLSERVGWRRGLGMSLAFIGVVVLAYDPQGFGLSLGVVFGALAALVGSIGGVVMKRMDPLPTFKLQAWIAMLSWPFILPLTLVFETDQLGSVLAMGWPYWGALAFSVVLVSIFGHGAFYLLLRRYEATLISPLTLMSPVWAVALGVWLLGEPMTAQLVVGAALALLGVGMVAVRPNAQLREAAAFWRRWQA